MVKKIGMTKEERKTMTRWTNQFSWYSSIHRHDPWVHDDNHKTSAVMTSILYQNNVKFIKKNWQILNFILRIENQCTYPPTFHEMILHTFGSHHMHLIVRARHQLLWIGNVIVRHSVNKNKYFFKNKVSCKLI